MAIDSKEEQYYTLYLKELEEAGYIDSWAEGKTYELGDKIESSFEKHLKKEVRIEQQTIMQGCVYTPDFEIHWNIKARGIFFDEFYGIGTTRTTKINKDLLIAQSINDKLVSTVETKGNYDFKQMNTLNAVNRKWLMQKHGIFTNLVKVPDIFKDTFTPKSYLMTDTGKQQRIIHHKIVTLQEYVDSMSKSTELSN